MRKAFLANKKLKIRGLFNGKKTEAKVKATLNGL